MMAALEVDSDVYSRTSPRVCLLVICTYFGVKPCLCGDRRAIMPRSLVVRFSLKTSRPSQARPYQRVCLEGRMGIKKLKLDKQSDGGAFRALPVCSPFDLMSRTVLLLLPTATVTSSAGTSTTGASASTSARTRTSTSPLLLRRRGRPRR